MSSLLIELCRMATHPVIFTLGFTEKIHMPLPKIIAIDGPAASGKSTVAERLADKLHYLYFDTGVMYRAVTLVALEKYELVDNEAAVTALAEEIQIDVHSPSVADGRKYDVVIDHRDITWQIRSPEVNANVSQVSTYPGVRRALTDQQRRIGSRGSVVMVGRDIGTVVFPDAEIKIYLDASLEERARRRYHEELQRGEQVDFQQILHSLKRRDKIDSTRIVAPLRPAADAYIINTDGLSLEEVFKKVELLIDP
jgi:cytidylate kinase